MFKDYESFVARFLCRWPQDAIITDEQIWELDNYLELAFYEAQMAVNALHRNKADVGRGIGECVAVLITAVLPVLDLRVRNVFLKWLFERMTDAMQEAGFVIELLNDLEPVQTTTYLLGRFEFFVGMERNAELRDSVAAFLNTYWKNCDL